MKFKLHTLIPAAGLALVLPVLQAADAAAPEKQVRKEVRIMTAPAGEPAPGGKVERKLRFIGGPEAGPGEMETVTFLGVMTRPLDETLSEQFGLQKDTGLVVAMVSEESPAAAALKAHDILLKLNDQILIDQHQLSVLVRNQKPGDEVTLTYIRAGKQATARVKLGQKEMPKIALFQRAFPGPGPMGGAMQWFGTAPGGVAAREDVDQLLGLIDLGKDGPPGLVRHNQVGGDRMISVTVDTKDSNLSFSDDKGSLEVKTKDGKKELTAKNEKGEVIFSGPINTPEERKALPAEVAERLGKVENMQGFSFKTDGDFEGGEVRVVRPQGHGISLRKGPVIQFVPRSTAF